VRVVRHWNRLPRKAVDPSSLEVFKASLDGTLRNLVKWKVSLPMPGRLELHDLCPGFSWDRVNFHKKLTGLTQTANQMGHSIPCDTRWGVG